MTIEHYDRPESLSTAVPGCVCRTCMYSCAQPTPRVLAIARRTIAALVYVEQDQAAVEAITKRHGADSWMVEHYDIADKYRERPFPRCACHSCLDTLDATEAKERAADLLLRWQAATYYLGLRELMYPSWEHGPDGQYADSPWLALRLDKAWPEEVTP